MKYKPLNPFTNEIRLIKLFGAGDIVTCPVKNVPLNNAPEYTGMNPFVKN
jgi:hypothetical protein